MKHNSPVSISVLMNTYEVEITGNIIDIHDNHWLFEPQSQPFYDKIIRFRADIMNDTVDILLKKNGEYKKVTYTITEVSTEDNDQPINEYFGDIETTIQDDEWLQISEVVDKFEDENYLCTGNYSIETDQYLMDDLYEGNHNLR